MQLSTVQLAKKLRISYATLHRWLTKEGLRPPKLRHMGGMAVRLWGSKDIARAKAFAKLRYRRKLSKLREEE
jgi:hypothetical protein